MFADLFLNARRKPRRSNAAYRRQRRPLQPERLEDRRLLAMTPEVAPQASAPEDLWPAVSAMEAQGEPPAKCLPLHNCDLGINQIYVSDEAGNRIDLPDAGGAYHAPVVGEQLFVRVEWSTHQLREGDGYSIAVTANGHTVIETFNAGTTGGTGGFWWVFPMGITQAGNNQIEVNVDATGQVAELNEDNNTESYKRQGVTSQWMVESITVSQNVPVVNMGNTIWHNQSPEAALAVADAIHTAANDPAAFLVTPKIRMWAVSDERLPMYYSWTIRDKGAIVDSQSRIPLDTEPTRLGTSLIEPSFAVLLPDRLGKYTLEFSLMMVDETGSEQWWFSEPHTLYVLFGDRMSSTAAELDIVMQLAQGIFAVSAFDTMHSLNTKLYEHAWKSGWEYTNVARENQKLSLFQPSAGTGNCVAIAGLLVQLAQRLGISGASVKYYQPGTRFLMPGYTSFDGQTGNAYRAGADHYDRWFLEMHAFVKLEVGASTEFFDPTFNVPIDLVGDMPSYVEAHAVYVPKREDLASDLWRATYTTDNKITLRGTGPSNFPIHYPNGSYKYWPNDPTPGPQNESIQIGEMLQSGTIEPLGRGYYEAYGVTFQIEGPPGEYLLDSVLLDEGRVLSSGDDDDLSVPNAIPVTIPPSGSTTVTLRFPGKDLAGLPSIEQLQAGISIFDAQGEWVGGDAIDLPAVSPTSFLAPAVAAIDSIVPTAWDGDGDGKIDELRFQVRTSNVNASDLIFDGQLFTAEGIIARATPYGSAGQLRVPARAMQEAGFDGPYRFHVVASYVDGRTMDTLEIETEAFTVADFEDLPVQFTESASFTTLDRDENGRADVLRLETTVDSAVAGDYRAIALLSDEEGNPVHTLVQSLRLETGPQSVVLDFPGVAIGRHGKSGSFTVKAIYLEFLTSGETVATSPHSWSTAHLNAAEFEEGRNLAFHNAQLPMDSSNDGVVSPLDALLVINYLNARGTGQLPAERGESPWIDVNGDGSVSPIDAVLTINYLNSRQSAAGESAATAVGTIRAPAQNSAVKLSADAAAATEISDQEIGPLSASQSSHDRWDRDAVDVVLETLWFFDSELRKDERQPQMNLVCENHKPISASCGNSRGEL